MIYTRLNDSYRNKILENCIRNARQLGFTRKPMWYYKKVLKGWFLNVPRDCAVLFAQQIDSMITALNNVYEDNWDFDFYVTAETKFCLRVIIRFPKIKITNSNGNEHDIEDLFVCFSVVPNYEGGTGNSFFKELEGTRATLSYKEWKKDYFHSHLGSVEVTTPRKAFYLKEFCLGVDTEIGYLEDSLVLEYDENVFQMYLYSIQTLVEWESLEGVPYKKIEDLTIVIDNRVHRRMSSTSAQDLYVYFRKKITSFDVDFVLQENKYKIIQNQKFKDYVKNGVLQMPSALYSRVLVIRNKENDFIRYSNIETEFETPKIVSASGERPKYLFRGEDIPFKVHPYDGERPDINAYFVHPDFIKYTAKQLEDELYEKTIRKHTIERYYQSQNVSTNTRQNPITV